MKQLAEDYVSYEIAVLLKEKGFNEQCVRFAYELGNRTKEAMDKDCPSNDDLKNIYTNAYSLPTHQMALAWLRENNFYIEIRRNINTFYFRWKIEEGATGKAISEYIYNTYEEAVEAAIKYTLENLI